MAVMAESIAELRFAGDNRKGFVQLKESKVVVVGEPIVLPLKVLENSLAMILRKQSQHPV